MNNDVKRDIFYKNYRRIFAPKLLQSQVNSYERIFDAFDKYEDDVLNAPAPYNRKDVLDAQLSYILATAYHEVGEDMRPVREGFKETDRESREYVARLHRIGFISQNYALPDPETGQSYYGRGFVQLTHKYNYLRAGQMLGLGDYFVWNPDDVMKIENAARILVLGMTKGIFTGKKLFTYIDAEHKDFVNARRIINGTDRAQLVAGYARKFEICVELH